jgi:hypothetical protein
LRYSDRRCRDGGARHADWLVGESGRAADLEAALLDKAGKGGTGRLLLGRRRIRPGIGRRAAAGKAMDPQIEHLGRRCPQSAIDD